jgi:hypothetical protein
MRCKKFKIATFILSFFISFCSPVISHGQRFWEASVAPGAVYNIPTRLTVRQGSNPISLVARYRTDPFQSPFYYGLKLATWKGNKGIAAKLTHHKLILKNRPQEIQLFSITDGFNLLTINRMYFSKGFIWSFGAGIVITHPESIIRQQSFPENKGMLSSGYYVSGPTAELALSRKHIIYHNFYVFGEGRFTGSYVQVPVVNGYAAVSNLAFHVLAGIGYQFRAGH